MKHLLLLFVFIVTSPIVHSQTEKKITAVVVCSDFALQGIDVVNLNSKKATITNATGGFSIMAKAGDQLMFVSKMYEYKTILLQDADFQNTDFTINLLKKPEELDEVVIVNTVKAPLVPNMQALLDTKYADDKYSQKKNPLLNDGTIPNGADLMRIGGMILGIFKKEKEKRKEIPLIEFKTLVNSNLDPDFFKKTLALKPEEVELFLEYCDADPNSKHVLDNPNPLKVMDFLMAKIVDFKKMPKN